MISLKTQIGWCAKAQFAVVGVILAIAALFYFVGYRPRDLRWRELTARIVQTRQDLEVSQTQARHLPDVAAEVQHLQGLLANTQKLPPTLDMGEFLNRITELERRDNLRSLSSNYAGAPKREDMFYELPVAFKFEGDFRDVFSFLCQVEQMPRLTRVQSIKIQHLDASGTVQVDLLMNLYYSEG